MLSRIERLVTLTSMSIHKGQRTRPTTPEMKIALNTAWQMDDGRRLVVDHFVTDDDPNRGRSGNVVMRAVPREPGQQRFVSMDKTYLVTHGVQIQ